MNYESQLAQLNHSINHAHAMIKVCERGGFVKSRQIYTTWLDMLEEDLEKLNIEHTESPIDRIIE